MTPHTLLVTWEHGGAGREMGRRMLAFDNFHCQNDYCSQVAGRSSLSPDLRRKMRAGRSGSDCSHRDADQTWGDGDKDGPLVRTGSLGEKVGG